MPALEFTVGKIIAGVLTTGSLIGLVAGGVNVEVGS